MPQLRKDPFGPTWVIISPERGLEPSDFGSAEPKSEQCPLCHGELEQLGSEVRVLQGDAAQAGGGWRARVIRPHSVFVQSKPFAVFGEGLFQQAPSVGISELVVEHPDHAMRLETMPKEHVVELLKLYRDRLEHLGRQEGVRHVQLTRNVGKVAGALYEHPHGQLLALPVGNRWVDEERGVAHDYYNRQGSCLFCDVLEAELKEKARLVSLNQAFVAVAPFASKTPFETWIMPREHASAFSALSGNAAPLLVELLQDVLGAMNAALDNPPYNMVLHTIPDQNAPHYHWNLKILPRLTRQAGFDWGSGFYINPTPPEDAARFLREAMALQGVGA